MRTLVKGILAVIVIIILVSSAYAVYIYTNEEKNSSPNSPSKASPVNNATGIGITTDLSWTGGDPDANDTVKYDVYFGTTDPLIKVSNNQSGTSYDPGELRYNTTYFWQIVAKDNHDATTTGTVWSFTTGEKPGNRPPNTPTSPSPSNSATQVSTSATMSWTGGDPDQGDHVTYTVYFGTTNPPSLVSTNQTGTTYNPGTLQFKTKYYWMIVSWDSSALSTAGVVWSFTTKQESNGGTPDYSHTVFIEEATAQWCVNCPAVASILHDLYKSGDYRFYYVSMVDDANTKAHQRLNQSYNVYGFPSVYIDGGYKVIVGQQNVATFKDAISDAMSRSTPKISDVVTAKYNNVTKKIEVTITVTNAEQQSYTGQLKVFLAEKVSHSYDFNGDAYSYGFLDYVIDKSITVSAGKTITETANWDVSQLDPENLMLFAVVFNSEKKQGYSQDSDKRPFDAYYADATNATEIVKGGNLPPSVGIAYPKKLYINIFGNAKRMAPLYKNTLLIGRITIKVNASDDSKVSRVEFTVDGTVKANDTSAPYEWTVRKFGLIKHILRKHTITVTAYDDKGKSTSTSIDVVAIFL